MEQYICIIVNPKAKLNKRTNEFDKEALKAVIDNRVDGFVVETENYESCLEAVAQQCKIEGVTIVGVNGGDGTLDHVFDTFIEVYSDTPLPKFLPMNGGTMNNLAWVHNIKKKNPRQVLERVVEMHERREEIKGVEQYLIHVRNLDTGRDFHGSVFAASPTAIKFLDEYYKSEMPGGKDVYRILKNVVTSGEYRQNFTQMLSADVKVDGINLGQEEYLLLLASVIPRITKYLNIFHHMPEPEKIDMIGSSLEVSRFVKYLVPAAGAGFLQYMNLPGTAKLVRPKDQPGFYDKCIRTLTIESEFNIPWTVDSESMPKAKRLEVKADRKVHIARVF